MVELFYQWQSPNGQTGYRKGIFKSYKQAWELIAYWNSFGGGWNYLVCQEPKDKNWDTAYYV